MQIQQCNISNTMVHMCSMSLHATHNVRYGGLWEKDYCCCKGDGNRGDQTVGCNTPFSAQRSPGTQPSIFGIVGCMLQHGQHVHMQHTMQKPTYTKLTIT
jgi:hypothetical protein